VAVDPFIEIALTTALMLDGKNVEACPPVTVAE